MNNGEAEDSFGSIRQIAALSGKNAKNFFARAGSKWSSESRVNTEKEYDAEWRVPNYISG
jgi:hypothetical protein